MFNYSSNITLFRVTYCTSVTGYPAIATVTDQRSITVLTDWAQGWPTHCLPRAPRLDIHIPTFFFPRGEPRAKYDMLLFGTYLVFVYFHTVYHVSIRTSHAFIFGFIQFYYQYWWCRNNLSFHHALQVRGLLTTYVAVRHGYQLYGVNIPIHTAALFLHTHISYNTSRVLVIRHSLRYYMLPYVIVA